MCSCGTVSAAVGGHRNLIWDRGWLQVQRRRMAPDHQGAGWGRSMTPCLPSWLTTPGLTVL